MTSRRPSLPPMPDLSHLTPDERAIIESVIQRQREEEDREQEILRNLQDDLKKTEQHVKKLNDTRVQTTQVQGNLGAVCDICHKTKFADGVGHTCTYCNLKSCARCGGKITVRTNQKPIKPEAPGVSTTPPTTKVMEETVWACNLCRKKQEILAKTGQWYHGGMAKPVQLDVDQPRPPQKSETMSALDKKSKFADHPDSGQSSSEKENKGISEGGKPPITRTGSLLGKELKRQYSMSDVDAKSKEMNERTRDRSPQGRERIGSTGHDREREHGQYPSERRALQERRVSDPKRGPTSPHREGEFTAPHAGSRHERHNRYDDFSERVPRDHLGREILEPNERPSDLIGRNHEQFQESMPRERDDRLRHSSRDRRGRDPANNDRFRDDLPPDRRREPSSDRVNRDSREQLDRRRTTSSDRISELGGRERYHDPATDHRHENYRDFRETPGRSRGDRHEPENRHRNDKSQDRMSDHSFQDEHDMGISRSRHGSGRDHNIQRPTSVERHRHMQKDMDAYDPYHSPKPSGFTKHLQDEVEGIQPNHDQLTQMQHLDPAAAAKNSKRNRQKMESMLRNDSLSSDPSDCPRPPPPKPHKHKKGKKLRQRSLSSSDDEIRSTPDCSSCEEVEIESESVSEKVTGRLRINHYGKSVYDDHYEQESWKKDEMLEAKIKKFLAHPVTWQPSGDGTKLIGHMILKKSGLLEGGKDSSAILGLKVIDGKTTESGQLEFSPSDLVYPFGLKVIGGKMTESGRLGAFITKVKKGSIADTVGHLRPGDEVLEWNGRSLKGATFEEVYDIIFESKQEPQVELIVQRNIGEGGPDMQELMGMESGHRSKYEHGHSAAMPANRPSVTITSPGSPGVTRHRPHSPQISGRVQVKLWYEVQSYQLIVTVLSAMDLPQHSVNQLRNPFCKLYLLPDRSEKSKRRTKTIAKTLEPKWNQTFIYSPLKPAELNGRALEVTVWDYDRINGSEFLGETILDLSTTDLHDEALWYQLRMDESSSLGSQSSVKHRNNRNHDGNHGNSNNSWTRAGVVGRGDGASVSSVGSSPPPSEDFSDPDRRHRNRAPSPLPIRRRGQSAGKEDLGARSNVPGSPIRQQPSSGNVTPTSTPSPKKRQLPQIPVQVQQASRDRVTQDLEERARQMKLKMKMNAYKQVGTPSSDSEAMYPRARSWDRNDERDRLSDHSGSGPNDRFDRYGDGKRRNHHSLDREGDLRYHSQDRVDRGFDRGFEREFRRDRHMGMDRGRERIRDYDGRHRRRAKEFSPDASDDALQSDASETSDMSEVSKISTISVRSTQSEKPRRKLSEFTSKMEMRGGGAGPAAPTNTPNPRPFNRSLSNTDVGQYDKNDGSVSDSAVTSNVTEGRKRRPSIGYKVAALVGLSRRSSSTSQLGQTGGKNKRTSFQRSEEVGAAAEMRNRMTRQASKESTDGSMGSLSGDSTNTPWLPSNLRLGPEGQFGDFVEGLGPAQLVGRQVLGSPCLGEIQLGLFDRKGHLEVEVIRARGLMAKPGAKVMPGKVLPAPYVKVYLMEGKNCIEKQKTTIARRTLDPLYQQQLIFLEAYHSKVLQVTVWGDYGRMDRKVFMGVAQIMLDDLDLSNIVIGWYKLFTTSSLINHHHRRSSSSSLESSGYQTGSTANAGRVT
ncbi:regulating synaptic membrane exocytosis protein 2-like isoform X3 [Lineus longissimus]|uniref:regulating synaptic membrane exocytosis protein 2-like isoform X3 n=1 Tax=Lineus longissimus TaxID=88925 RepID=UPI00315D921A